MRRAKKQRRLSPSMASTSGPFDLGGVPLGGMAHPLGSHVRGRGRLGRKLKAGGKKAFSPARKQQPSPISLARWETDGGSPAPRTTSDRAKNIQSTHARKKPAAGQSMKKFKKGPGRSR